MSVYDDLPRGAGCVPVQPKDQYERDREHVFMPMSASRWYNCGHWCVCGRRWDDPIHSDSPAWKLIERPCAMCGQSKRKPITRAQVNQMAYALCVPPKPLNWTAAIAAELRELGIEVEE